MPAAATAIRRQRLGHVQLSDTSQYRQGVKTSSIMPISWHSPPKCLQTNACPSSCSTLTTASVAASQSTFCIRRKELNSGSLAKTASIRMATKAAAPRTSSRHRTRKPRENIQRTRG